MEEKKKNNFLIIGKGLLISYAMSLILIAIYSALLAYTNVPESSIPICVIAITIISIIFSSASAVRKIKENGLINGGILGAMYVMILYIISSIFSTGFSFAGISISMIFTAIVAGVIGGIIGVNL